MKKFNLEDIKKYINDVGCNLVGEYKDILSDITVRCSCGEEYITTFNRFKNKNQIRCKQCSGSFININTVIDTIQQAGCELITSSENYQGVNSKIEVQCSCGNNFETTFSHFKKGINKCRKCRNNKKGITFQEIKEFIEIDSGSECILISTSIEFENNSSILQIRCKCGEIFETSFSKFCSYDGKHSKKQCDNCGLGSRRGYRVRSFEDLKYEVENISGCILLTCESEYKTQVWENNISPNEVTLILLCSVCKHETFETNLRRLKERKKAWCYSCSMKNRMATYEEVKNFIEIESCSSCILISGEYLGSIEPLEIKCHCGNIFNATYDLFKNNNKRQCNYHNISNGEKIITKYLETNNSQYKTQYIIENCKNINPLPFDFAVFDNDKLQYLIEYDGEHHFSPVSFGEKDEIKIKEKFERQIKHDNIKNEYCSNNNIILIRIPYWEFNNIDSILENEHKKFNGR